jgi:ribosomal protein S18 acetylase RimI-like enzyme
MESDLATIVEYDNSTHRNQVIDLWKTVFGYEAEHNSPEVVIEMKIKNKDGLFFVAEKNQYIIATVMAGYDGHRGWIYSIAVHPDYRKQGIGSDLLTFIQGKLTSLGCLKVNLQIMEGNEAVQKFYKANGFSVEQRVSMGKKLY